MKVIFKFNSGMGAILCHRCSRIIQSNISEEEARKSKLYYCNKCLQKINQLKEKYD
jgi:hypothetical protein